MTKSKATASMDKIFDFTRKEIAWLKKEPGRSWELAKGIFELSDSHDQTKTAYRQLVKYIESTAPRLAAAFLVKIINAKDAVHYHNISDPLWFLRSIGRRTK